MSKKSDIFRMGLIGKKVGMTQIFINGERVPVTVVELGPCTIVQKKTKDGKDGYNAVQIGFADKEHRKVNKPMSGHFKRADVKPKRILQEIRVPDDKEIAAFNVGQEIKASIFAEGQFIDVTGTSKGKGFAGVMKMHNMKGSKQWTHGTHEYFRHVGSIGCRTTPGRVHPGKRMPKHMGDVTQTTQNLKIMKVDAEKNIVLIAGSVPGARDSYVMVRPAMKKLARARNTHA